MRHLMIICFLLVSPLSLATEDNKPAKLFSNTEMMEITLTGPWALLRKRIEVDASYAAQMTYQGIDGQAQTVDIEAEPRGKSRRHKICDFPPLKIHLKKKKMKDTVFRGNKKLHMVTYCKNKDKYEQYYIKEFLAYRIYNQITELSVNVKPLMIDFTDSKSGKTITRFGFLTEDFDDTAKRNNLQRLTTPRVHPVDIDPLQTSYFSLFQYLIGNLDWSALSGPDKDRCCHNARLIGTENTEKPRFVIPYDFDSSGLVNASYALPPDSVHIRTVKTRVYRGFCAHNQELPKAVSLFEDKKADILALFKNSKVLSPNNQKYLIKYIEDFYATLADPKRFKKEITDKCRGKAVAQR